MATITQKERIATLEAGQSAHEREHELNDRIWMAKLDAIDARVRGVERILLELRLPRPGADDDAQETRKPLTRRDLSVISGSAAITSLLWWLVELASQAAS